MFNADPLAGQYKRSKAPGSARYPGASAAPSNLIRVFRAWHLCPMCDVFCQPPKQDKKKDTGKSKKDKDPVNKSGGKAKKKVCWFF